MTQYTVETVTGPVIDGNWSQLRSMTDTVPGTLLIEDADEPMLIFPVEAQAAKSAAVFIEGVMSVVGLPVVWGRVYESEHICLDEDCDEQTGGTIAEDLSPRWLESAEETERLITA